MTERTPTAGWVPRAYGGPAFPNEPSPDDLDQRPTPSLYQMARGVGPCVYFFRTKDGLIKIGFTTNLGNRRHWFGIGWNQILAIIRPGDLDIERAHHAQFAEHLARGREWFHPAPDLIDYINDIRSRLGVPPVDPFD